MKNRNIGWIRICNEEDCFRGDCKCETVRMGVSEWRNRVDVVPGKAGAMQEIRVWKLLKWGERVKDQRHPVRRANMKWLETGKILKIGWLVRRLWVGLGAIGHAPWLEPLSNYTHRIFRTWTVMLKAGERLEVKGGWDGKCGFRSLVLVGKESRMRNLKTWGWPKWRERISR